MMHLSIIGFSSMFVVQYNSDIVQWSESFIVNGSHQKVHDLENFDLTDETVNKYRTLSWIPRIFYARTRFQPYTKNIPKFTSDASNDDKDRNPEHHSLQDFAVEV